MILAINPIWISIGPVLIINAFLFLHLMIFAATHDRWPVPEDMKGRSNSKFLSGFFKEWWYWVNMPIARLLVKMGLSPNSITFIGFLFSIVAAILFAIGQFGYAGWVMIFGATFDMFDGKVARLTGRESRSGAYFDSVMDRFGEGVVMIGLAVYFRSSWMLYFVVLALIGSMLVSYTRARGEGVGVICKKGSMQRPERIVYLGVGSILQPLAGILVNPWWGNPPPFLVIGAIIIIAVMTNVTAVYRMIYIMNALDEEDKKGIDTIPKLLTKFSTKEGRESWWLKVRYGYERSKRKYDSCVLFLADGADSRVMEEMRQRGDLPNIQKYIADKGTATTAVSVFPSTSGPAFTPFVTGCFPGTCNIPGIRWFDRTVPKEKRLTVMRFRDYYGWGSYALDFDLSKDVRTIFEYSKKAVNILGMLNRGAGVVRDPAFFKIPYFFFKVKKHDDVRASEESAFRWFEQAIKKRPDFVFYYYPSIDRFSHDFYKEHELVRDTYKRLDDYVGRVAKTLAKRGELDETLFILVSDHGHSNVDRHFDLDSFLESRYRTLYMPRKFREWEGAEAINMVSGNSMSNIYLRAAGDWGRLSFFEELAEGGLIKSLVENDAVDVVAGRSTEGGVAVRSKVGSAHIVLDEDGRISYRVGKGDPFGFGELPHVMSAKEELLLTAESDYPDAILQIAQIFRSLRAGDVVVSAATGFDLRDRFEKPPHYSTHGSLRRDHMIVPLYASVPLGKGFIRTTDIFATVLKFLGIVPVHRMDGVSLV